MGKDRTYTVIVESGEDGWYVAHCPAIPGCVSQGRTFQEATANIKEAIEVCLESYEEDGIAPPPDASIEVRVEKIAV